MVKLTDHDSLSRETVRRRPAENHLKPWQKDMWYIPKVDAEYVARMEDVLDLYAEQLDPEAARGLLRRKPPPSSSAKRASRSRPHPDGSSASTTSIRRNGTVNLFVFVDAHRSWRRVKVTDRRTADDFALCMRELVDVDSTSQRPSASASSSITSPPTPLPLSTPHSHRPKRAACSRRLEFHYTPKPSPAGSTWLRSRSACSKANVSIAASKAPTCSLPRSTSGSLQRNQSGARINWMFSTDKARTKMARAYPDPSLKEP